MLARLRNQSFHLFSKVWQFLAPTYTRRACHGDLNTVDDFLDRHCDEIAVAIRPKPFVHMCPHPPGRRMWLFSRRWPFVHTWISKAVCCCDINAIMSQHRSEQLLGEITDILQRGSQGCDLYAGFSQKSQAEQDQAEAE